MKPSGKLFHTLLTLFIAGTLTSFSGCNSEQVEEKNNVIQPAPTEEKDSTTEVPPEENIPPKKLEANQSAFNWLKLSGWHTQGTISRDTSIRIVFNRDIIGDSLIGKDASKVMHITPAIKGKPIFKNKSEIVWKPAEPLQPGSEYKVSIKAIGFKDVPSDAPPYQFSFHIIPLEFEIKTLGLTSVANEENKMSLEGQLLTSDRIPSKGVEAVLKATLQGKPLPIDWTHDSSGKKHRFVIKDIIRETFATDVKLSWDGSPINIKTQGNKDIAIPALDEFKITSIRVVHEAGSNPYVQVRFSDELDESQNIKGLVQLAKNKYKVRINGNLINIYPNKNISGEFKVTLNKGIKAKTDKVLDKDREEKVTFDDIKPQVKFVGNGSILPENSTLEIPFKAVGANAIEVTAFEIYPDNMGHFLQVNRLSGDYETRRSGRYMWRKTIPLNAADPNQWNRYSFNVTELMKEHYGGLVRLTLSIKRRHSTYSCSGDTPAAETRETLLKNLEDNGVQETSGWDGISDYIEQNSGYDFDWNDRNNPCTDSYFVHNNHHKTSVSQNFIASNIGLITKQDAQGNLRVISTDIRTAEPLTGVEFEVRNFQGQPLAKAISDGSGFATIELSATPFLLIAKKFKDTAYLKLNAKTALAVSHFDVGGKKIKKGLKGIIYGERGVWRPGDNIYLTFALQDKTGKIPAGHPVTMKLFDPRGRVVKTKTSTDSVGGFYAFRFKTKEKAETGNWMVKAYLGGSTFSKSLMIETVRPNRLKMELSFDGTSKTEPVLYKSDGNIKGTLFSQWLHGATASKLKADISVKFSKKKTRFGKFTDFIFDDPARQLASSDKVLLEGRLDNKGYLKFDKKLKTEGYAAGMLNARFTSRVFEEGGAFSISRSSADYHPYDNYVGIKLPKGDATRGMLLTDKTHTIKLASLSSKGEAVSMGKVQVSLYKIDWKWWWDKSAESLTAYADSSHKNRLKQEIVSTTNGEGEWGFEIKYPEWGRYLIRACDLDGKHCSGKTVYIDWPGWAGRAQEEGSGAASRLNLFSDKTAYTVGEVATIQLPAATQGRALLTIETGSSILDQRWIELDNAKTVAVDGKNKIQVEVPITPEMSPNAFVHISMLQPHKDKNNDRPIRLYGIIPLEVADPKTYLKPKIMVDEEWKPESKQKIKVTETNGKTMNYTLAVVDEGLLGLTAFKTPNLHKHFYSKEALGIKTWDLFDEVIGAYGGKLERMLALGGGDADEADNEDSKKRRFPPVVKFFGPFTLKGGETAEHDIKLPPYLGAVRVMLVAGENGAYGKAQESVFIRQSLMLQASLPRVLGPDEEVAVPVTLFAMDDSIKDVTVSVKTDDLVSVVGDAQTKVSFSQTGEKIAFIKLKTANKIGKTHIHFTATAMTEKGEQKSEADIYLNIRQPNPESARSMTQIIEPGSSWDSKADAFGLDGTNKAIMEISSVPSLNLEKRLSYLIRYPHGCLEQTTSSAFPQLFLSNVTKLSEKKQKQTEHNIKKAIERLQRFQRGSGNFSYWPGGDYDNAWASVYAGHFLIEAQKNGYLLPSNLLEKWLNFQIDEAQNFVVGSKKYAHTQAYRLYVLALEGKPQMGAMNRLRENSTLNAKARWLLASAYQSASQPAAAKSVIEGLMPDVKTVARPDSSFSSTLGDLGLQLDSLVTLDKKQDANKLLEEIAMEMSGDKFQSTQGIAWALMAVSRYLGGDTSNFTATLTQDGAQSDITSDKPISKTTLLKPDSSISLKNTSGVKLFATLVNKGVAKAGSEQAQQKGFELGAKYEIRDEVDPKKWNDLLDKPAIQGRDIRITIYIRNTSNHDTENIALTIPVAAGMEILSAAEQKVPKSLYDYRDIRDDRVHYYFGLKKDKDKTFELLVNATYKGRYYLPAVNVEAMYDGTMQARKKGRWLSITTTDAEFKEVLNKKSPVTNIGAVAIAAIDAKDTKQVEIKVAKAWLYNSADEASKTAMFIIADDKATELKREKSNDGTEWIFIRYIGKKTLEKWIKAETIK